MLFSPFDADKIKGVRASSIKIESISSMTQKLKGRCVTSLKLKAELSRK